VWETHFSPASRADCNAAIDASLLIADSDRPFIATAEGAIKMSVAWKRNGKRLDLPFFSAGFSLQTPLEEN
jgi:hypothetical protein